MANAGPRIRIPFVNITEHKVDCRILACRYADDVRGPMGLDLRYVGINSEVVQTYVVLGIADFIANGCQRLTRNLQVWHREDRSCFFDGKICNIRYSCGIEDGAHLETHYYLPPSSSQGTF